MNKEAMAILLGKEHVDFDAMPEDALHTLFETFNERMMTVYLFVLKYNDYINNRHNYGADAALTMLEVHLLTDICDHPGSTVTSLAANWSRSVSATSQTIRKLMQKGLVTRTNSREDAKVFFLHPTEEGVRVSEMHKRYDVRDTVKTLKSLRHSLTAKEIEAMFKGLDVFIGLLKKK